MMMQKNFLPLDPDMTKNKYPSEHRPETILTDETGTINLMFQYMEGEVSDATIENFRNQIFGMIAYVEFSNPAMDGKLYNLMFYLAVKGQPLMGSFNCRTKEMKYWRPVAFEMIQSIETVETIE